MMKLVQGSKNKYQKGGATGYTLQSGKTRIRILAVPVVGSPVIDADPDKQGQFWLDVGRHWIKTTPGEKAAAVVGDRELIYGQPDPITAVVERAIRSAVSDDDIKLMESWKTQKKVAINALVRQSPDGKTSEDQPEIVELPPGVWGKILGQIETYALDGIDATDLKSGLDFVIEKSGTGLKTEYNITAMAGSKPVNPAAVKNAHDLFAYVERECFRDGDEQKALRAIGDVTGIVTPGIAPTARSAGLLTAQPSAPAANRTPAPPTAPAPAASLAESAELKKIAEEELAEDSELAELERRTAELRKRKAQQHQPAPPTAPLKDVPFDTELDDADVMSSALEDLDSLV